MIERNIIDPDYSLFHAFIDRFTPVGFLGIDPCDPLIIELEEMMAHNNQFIYVADPIQMKILYTSMRSRQMIGIAPEELSFYHFMERTHKDDKQRLSLGRTKLLKTAQDIFIAGKGKALLSANIRMLNGDGKYSNFLLQNYLYYSKIPYKTVFFLKIHTKIDWCKKIKNGYHYYVGKDFSFLRFPDDELLQMGNVFTDREFEIIKLIESGLSSEQIADALFLSVYTINTHRRNILKKSGKTQISDLIYDLKERGVI